MKHGKTQNSKQLQKTNLAIDNSLNHQGVVFICIYTQYLISLLVKSNIPLHTIMSRVGHRDAKMTNQIYTHITKSMQQATIYSLATVTLNQK